MPIPVENPNQLEYTTCAQCSENTMFDDELLRCTNCLNKHKCVACDHTGQCTECAENTYLKINESGENQCIDCSVFDEHCKDCNQDGCQTCKSDLQTNFLCAMSIYQGLNVCYCKYT